MLSTCCCGGGITCSPCDIPVSGTLTLTVYNSIYGNGTATMTYNSSTQTWTGTYSGLFSNTLTVNLTCFSSGVRITTSATGCPVGSPCTYPGSNNTKLKFTDYTCSPYHLHFQTPPTPYCISLNNCGYTDIYIDG